MRHRYNIKHYIIIGSSFGLGAALVEELLSRTSCRITGVARTNFEKIQRYRDWAASGRYNHIELDITLPVCYARLKSLCSEFPPEPMCVIFNAARVATDINKNGTLNYEVFSDINRVGIEGLGNILAAFQEHLLKYGGVLAGISSFSSFTPPLLEQRVAYPSSKAYLDMAFRCLRVVWGKKVNVVIIHLGHIGYPEDKTLPRWIAPTYNLVAKKIVKLIASGKAPQEINYPVLYCLVYKYIFKFIPDRVCLNLLRLLRYFIKPKKL